MLKTSVTIAEIEDIYSLLRAQHTLVAAIEEELLTIAQCVAAIHGATDKAMLMLDDIYEVVEDDPALPN